MSDTQQPAPATPQAPTEPPAAPPPAAPPAGSIEAAVAAAEAAENPPAAAPAAAPAPAAPAATEPELTPSERWAKMSTLDAENRQLKAQLAERGDQPTLKQALDADPDGVWNAYLEHIGLDPEAEGAPAEPAAPQSAEAKRIADLEAKLAKLEQTQETRDYNSMIASEKHRLGMIVDRGGDRWGAVKAFGQEALDLAIETAQAWVSQNATNPPPDVILDHVEAHYREQAKRYQALGGQPQATPQPAPAPTQPQPPTPQQPRAPGLTAGQEEGTPAPSEPNEEERMKRALEAMERAEAAE